MKKLEFEEEFLQNILFAIADSELKIEGLRQTLSKIEDFIPFSLYSHLAGNQEGKGISLSNLLEFLAPFDFRIDEISLQPIMKFFDFDKDDCLCFSEYSHFTSQISSHFSL